MRLTELLEFYRFALESDEQGGQIETKYLFRTCKGSVVEVSNSETLVNGETSIASVFEGRIRYNKDFLVKVNDIVNYKGLELTVKNAVNHNREKDLRNHWQILTFESHEIQN